MAISLIASIGLFGLSSRVTSLTTCPGFPGFCSESFPGQLCNVVCDFGRNNVPLCQEDGTWSDIPRCVEHDPGVEEQIPGLCPAVPGYCGVSFLNKRCKFDCVAGPDINSICTADGTWLPYPTCQGDLRETRDGCDGCPGPNGGPRDRTAEALDSRNRVSGNRVPKLVTGNGARKSVPSFAGNINIGPIDQGNLRQPQAQQARQQLGQSQRQPQQPRREPPRFTAQSGGSLFDQIKNRIQSGNRQQQQQQAQTSQSFQSQPATPQRPRQRPTQQVQGQRFGVFEAVNLGGGGGPSPPETSDERRQPPQSGDNFFGEFESVSLRG